MRHLCSIGLGAGILCDQAGEVRQGMTCRRHRELGHATIRANSRCRIQLFCRDLSSALQLGVIRAAGSVDVGVRGVWRGRGNPAVGRIKRQSSTLVARPDQGRSERAMLAVDRKLVILAVVHLVPDCQGDGVAPPGRGCRGPARQRLVRLPKTMFFASAHVG